MSELFCDVYLAILLYRSGWRQKTLMYLVKSEIAVQTDFILRMNSDIPLYIGFHIYENVVNVGNIPKKINAPTLGEISLPTGWHVWQEKNSGLWYIYDNYHTDPFDDANMPIGYNTELEARAHGWIMAKKLGLFEKGGKQ